MMLRQISLLWFSMFSCLYDMKTIPFTSSTSFCDKVQCYTFKQFMDLTDNFFFFLCKLGEQEQYSTGQHCTLLEVFLLSEGVQSVPNKCNLPLW